MEVCLEKLKDKKLSTITAFKISILLNLIILLFYLLSKTMKYEVSDDFIMEMIVSGKNGTSPSSEIMFMNIWIGMFLSRLYCLNNNINWYFLFQVVCVFMSLSILSYCILNRNINKATFCVTVTLLLFYSNDLYQLMQFTKTSISCIFAGAILLIDCLFYKKNRKKLVLGFFALFIGASIRFDCLYIAGPFVVLIYIIFLLKKYKTLKKYKDIFDFIIISLKYLCIGLIIVGGIKAFDYFYCQIDREYGDFKNYSELRANILDKPYFTYEHNKDKFEKIGVTKSDFQNLIHWDFADSDYYTENRLKQIGEILEESRIKLKENYKTIIIELLNKDYYKYIALLGCFCLLGIGCILKKRYLYLGITFILISFIELFMFRYLGRIVYRIEYASLFCAGCSLAYSIQYFENRFCVENYKALNMFTAILLVLHIPSMIPVNNHNSYEQMYFSSINVIRKYRASFYGKNIQENLINEIKSNKDNIYFLGFNSTIQSIYLNYTPMYGSNLNIFENAFYFAGVDSLHPSKTKALNKLGIGNQMEGLLSENVYLVENEYQEEILSFLREHYNDSIQIKLIKSIDGYNIWKYYLPFKEG